MQSAMNEAASRVVRDMMLGTAMLNFEQYSQFVVLHVSRNSIVADTLEQLFKYDSIELKRPLRVSIKVFNALKPDNQKHLSIIKSFIDFDLKIFNFTLCTKFDNTYLHSAYSSRLNFVMKRLKTWVV